MILFFYENTPFRLSKLRFEKALIKELIERERRGVGDINFIFCDDDYLLNINKEYLDHDYYTDVITFDTKIDSNDKKISGDIFISIDSVKVNALYYKVSFETELARVMAHGVLHLIGYDDCDEDSIAMMRRKENDFLKMKGLIDDQ